MSEVKLQSADDMARCWCGRSPTGKCDGSHTFTEDQWAEINYEFKDKSASAQESWFNKTDDYWNKDLK